jgi:putative DNA-invertase from lambdoid prophage Rac
MPVYTYVRVSTQQQVNEGQSLVVQDRQCQGYALMHGFKVDLTFVEQGVSGSVPLQDRTEGGILVSTIRRGDIVITPKLDRMFRSAADALEMLAFFKENGVQLHMLDLGGDVTGNGISKLIFTILSAVAEAERDRTTERIRDVKKAQKIRGQFLGGKLPYGYRVDRANGNKLVPDEKQQRNIQTIIQYSKEGYSLRAIQIVLSNISSYEQLQAGTFDGKLEAPSLVTISRIIKDHNSQSAAQQPIESLKDD